MSNSYIADIVIMTALKSQILAQEITRSQGIGPWTSPLSTARSAACAILGELSLVDAGIRPAAIKRRSASLVCGMLGRIVAEPDVKGEGPAHADQGEDDERPPPADPVNQPLRGRVRGRPADQHRRRDDPLRTSSRRIGKPSRKTRAEFGNAPASPAPNRNRIDDQRPESPGRTRERREERPPDHDPRQDAPRAVAVAPPTGRNLEDRVGQRERPEDDALLRLARSPVPS